MNKHVAPADVSPLRLLAVPGPGNAAAYSRLTEVEMASYALFRHILEYRAIPAHPMNADYRARQWATIEEDMANMRKALSDG